MVNERYYNIDGTERPLEDIRQQLKWEVNNYCGYLLQSSDWYVIRSIEDSSKPVPTEIETYRAAMRQEADQKTVAIEACVTLQDFINYDNTEPMSNWPDRPANA